MPFAQTWIFSESEQHGFYISRGATDRNVLLIDRHQLPSTPLNVLATTDHKILPMLLSKRGSRLILGNNAQFETSINLELE